MKYITAFFMAWGNFLNIPCPVRKWDDKLKKEMLKMLPSVGLVIGLLWFIIAILLWKIGIAPWLSGFLLTAYIYIVTGFLHLDGFMDCRDAIMSRRDLAERQRILKDSRVGAFSVISVVLLIVGMYAAATAFMELMTRVDSSLGWINFFPLLVIPIVSRHEAGVDVLRYKPMKTSQYSDMETGEPGTKVKKTKEEPSIAPLAMVLQTIPYILIPFIIGIIISGREAASEISRGAMIQNLGSAETLFLIPFNLAWACTLWATYASIKISKNQLGGMNGDIAGQGICIGEVVGLFITTVSMSFLMRV